MYNVYRWETGGGGEGTESLYRNRTSVLSLCLSYSLSLSLSLYSHVLADFLTVVGGRGVYQIMGERVGISDSCMISLSLRVRIMYSQYEYKYTPPPLNPPHSWLQ